MIGTTWLVVRKDVRQQALVLVAWVSLVVLRALLVGTGLDVHVDVQRLLTTSGESLLRIAYWTASLMQMALMVAIAAQVIHSDCLVGTTAFWLTRPIPRWRLAAAKLLSPFLLLVALPMLVEALVLAANGAGGPDLARALGESALERTVVLVPVMAVAAVTANLGTFVIAGIASMTGTVLVAFLFQVVLKLGVRGRSVGAVETGPYVATAVLVTVCLLALLHQVRTRRTGRSVMLLATGVVLFMLVGDRWAADWTSKRTLEAGLFDPARITVAFGPAPVDPILRPNGQRFFTLRATLATPPPRPDVVLVPLALAGVTCGPDGRPAAGPGRMFTTAYAAIRGPMYVRSEVLGPLLGGVEVLNGMQPSRPEADPFAIATLDPPDYERAMRDGSRCAGEMTLGAVQYSRGADLPLRTGLAAPGDDPGLTVLSASCDDGACDVVLRDVAVVFSFTGRASSHLEYWLVDPARRIALVGQQRDARSFGRASLPILAEHLGITHRVLRFEAAPGSRPLVASEWLKDGRLVAVHVRDAGRFVRPFAIDDVRTIVAK
jgi:hypothetical protein